MKSCRVGASLPTRQRPCRITFQKVIMTWLLAHGGSTDWLPLEMTPIHPILVNFTAALIPTSFLADVLGRCLRKQSLTETAWWTLLLAAIVTPLTAAAGWYWMRQMDMPGMDSRQMAIHQWLGISLAVLFIALAAWRGRFYRRATVPGYAYLGLLALLCGLLTVQGHLGGVMSFGDSGGAEIDSNHAAPPKAGMPEVPGMHDRAIGMPVTDLSTMPNSTQTPATEPATRLPATPAPSTAASTTDADGWSDVIHVKGHHP